MVMKNFQYILEPSLRPQSLTDFVIGSGKEGFMLDAVFRLSAQDLVLMQRYIMPPASFKRLVKGFQTALEGYEKEHGIIDDGLSRIVKSSGEVH